MGGETGTCLLFKVHQEAPGDQDQVQPLHHHLLLRRLYPPLLGLVPTPAPGPSVPAPHTPLPPQTSPGSRPQMAPSPPASRSPRR